MSDSTSKYETALKDVDEKSAELGEEVNEKERKRERRGGGYSIRKIGGHKYTISRHYAHTLSAPTLSPIPSISLPPHTASLSDQLEEVKARLDTARGKMTDETVRTKHKQKCSLPLPP